MTRGKLILVLGPTGSGKGTLVRHALETFPSLEHSISCTTRAARPGETGGVEYYFLTEEEFKRRIEAGDFLEWAQYGHNWYGTLRSEVLPRIEAGTSVILEIEVQGVRQICSLMAKQDVFTIYIDAGSWEALEARVRARAPMSEEEIEKRKQRYADELSYKNESDVVVSNLDGGLESAKTAMVAAITSTVGV